MTTKQELEAMSERMEELVEALTSLLEAIPESVAEAANIQDECYRASFALAGSRAPFRDTDR